MLHINKATKTATLAAVCLILLAGILHLVGANPWWTINKPLACLGPMIYVGLLLSSIALMILWFVLCCAKYDFFEPYII